MTRRLAWPRARIVCRECSRQLAAVQTQLVPIAPWLPGKVRGVAEHHVAWRVPCQRCHRDLPVTVGDVLAALERMAA